jgi:hypothetical protein
LGGGLHFVIAALFATIGTPAKASSFHANV